jgi:hypothetical protein
MCQPNLKEPISIEELDRQVAEAYAQIPDQVEEVEIWRSIQVWEDEWDENIVLAAPAGTDHPSQNEKAAHENEGAGNLAEEKESQQGRANRFADANNDDVSGR